MLAQSAVDRAFGGTGRRLTVEDVSAIGGELDERDGRVLVVDDGLQAVPGLGVPDAAQAVVAAGHDQRAVTVEVHLLKAQKKSESGRYS